MLTATTRLNTFGTRLAQLDGVHAMTDVTGFGLLGHLLELCRASSLGADIDAASVPLLPQALSLLEGGCVTGASARNWQSYGDGVQLDPALPAPWRPLLTEPPTRGGFVAPCAETGQA